MQRYRWPGYEMQLLGELQRQQNNAQFCDTLLITEGISIPTHSCILAALSPYLSQKLSSSPIPPLGQNRKLHLQAVKAQTLLKLVSLLYSGEVEVEGSVEQNDVLSAAHQFGITYLVEGQKNGGWEEGEPSKYSFGSCREEEEGGRERNVSRKMQDVQVQTEMVGGRDADSPMEKRRCTSTGTHISSVHSGAQSDGGSTLDRSSDSATNLTSTSTLSSDMMTFPICLNDDSNSPTPQEEGAYQQPSECGDNIQVLAMEGKELEDGKTNGKTADTRKNTEQSSPSNGDEMLGMDKGNSTEKRLAHANEGIKSLAKLNQMHQIMETETTQISIKVKLRRRTKGEVWEVVNMQDTDETLSVLASLRQDGSNHKSPETDLTNSRSPPSSVQPGRVHKPETQILQPATTAEPPPHPNTPSDSQLLSTDCFAPNQNGSLESVLLPQPAGPVEECDEQIEKLLEDIMMGLNILPNLERDCKKSHYLQPNHDGTPDVCQVPVTENERPQCRMHASVSTAGCLYYQDFGTQIGHSSTDTDQNQPSCSSLSSVHPVAVRLQQQQKEQWRTLSSVAAMGQDGTSHQDIPLPKSQNSSYPEAPTTISVIPTALYSSGQKPLTTPYYPACQEQFSHDSQSILEVLPMTNGNKTQSSHSLPCMDDLRLPQCLSPLEPSALAAKHQPTLNNSRNQSDKIQPQPCLHGRPWLTVNPGILQFPLSAIPHRANVSASLPQDTKQWQNHMELNPQNGASSCTLKEKERGVISAGHQNVAELKSDPRKVKRSLKCKQGNTKGDAVAPQKRKRKHTGHPQEASSLLPCKHGKVCDGTKGQINLSICSVSLSSNNVLAKEREVASSLNNGKSVGKPNELSTITGSWREIPGGPWNLKNDQTRIRTRGFLKTPAENSILKPVASIAQIVNKEGAPKRGRGRPRKPKVDQGPPESSPAVTENKSHSVEEETQIDSKLLKEESEESKTRCKKQMRTRSKVEAVLPKKSLSTEADNNNDVIPVGRKLWAPNKPRMVSLKEFQKLIVRHHSKTRKSQECQDKETNETGGVESGGKTYSSTFEELTKETEMDVAQPENSHGTEKSHVLLNVTVDENHNQIFSKLTAEYGRRQDDHNSPASKETSLLGGESHSVFSSDVAGEEVAAGREQPLKSPDEAQNACDTGMSDTTQQSAVSDEGPSHTDTQLTQEDKMPQDHKLNPQTPERTSPPLSDTVGFSKCSGGDHEEEEDEEVDVLLYSPDKVLQTGQCENGIDNMEITPEEEEEEDGNEIDVTGDEEE